jgi:glycosyltransferase involved in cell wall biosynthesis
MSGMDSGLAEAVVVIPSLEPKSQLIEYVSRVSESGFGKVVVVDDGSGANYREIFERIGSLKNVVVLTHPENLGKGAALKTAFQHVQDFGQAHVVVITADSDGQHELADVIGVAKASLASARQGQLKLVLGVRELGNKSVPWKSRLGNQITSALVKLLFGKFLVDTQTGLRAYPKTFLPQLIQTRGDRFEYEMHVLFDLMNKKVPMVEVPVKTVYLDSENSNTHFRPLIDSARIYFVIFGQFFGFASSSILSAVIDIALFALIIDFAFGGSSAPTGVVISVVLARIVSSLVNFGLNKGLVFSNKDKKRRTLLRYYSLAALVLTSSAIGSAVMAQVLEGRVVWAKIVVDSILFVFSYLIQRRWVFQPETEKSK